MTTSAPLSLIQAETKLSALIRSKERAISNSCSGISLYREIIRENILGVLHGVFPLFCQSLDPIQCKQLIDDFLGQHSANQPEFHQIATELLLFIRQEMHISSEKMTLIEYEWLIYAVEIDENHVPQHQNFNLQPNELNLEMIEVHLNPTLKLIALPFWLKDGEACYEHETAVHYYALYRKHSNILYQKKLSQIDVQLLSMIYDSSVITTVALLKDKSHFSFSVTSLLAWLTANNNDECLSLIRKS